MRTNQADVEPEPIIVDPVQLELGQPKLPPIRPETPPILNRPYSPDEPIPQGTCMTCMVVRMNDSEYRYIVLPCGHAWVCGTCVNQLQLENATCAMCRATNITFQKMYFS